MPFRGERLREVREKKGLSQRELCALSGLEEAQLSRYENGKMGPSLKYLETLAQHLDVSADYLLGLTDDPRSRSAIDELSADEYKVVETLRREGWKGVIHLGAERVTG
jgi:transcriptional regulator with XRE-family HTH domain